MADESFPPEDKIPELSENLAELPKKEALTIGSRLLFVLVAVIGLGSLIWGGWRMNQNFKQPFLAKGSVANTNNDINNLIALQGKDTDGDGLSDYDETYVYKTSPYLKDTDSDGFADKTEIDTGNNPNCPAGQNCGLPEANTNTNSSSSPILPDTSGINQILSGSLTADQIRAMLLQSGVAQAELDKIDDATLLQLYQQALKEQATSNAAGAMPNTNVNTNTNTNVSDLKNLSASQVRELLIKQGANKADLDKIDDATLLKNWQEIIAEEEASATNSNK